jgi:hypothetical protein
MPLLPLVVQKGIERGSSWEGISTPNDIANFIARTLAVDPSAATDLQEAIYSDVKPTRENAKKIWIKTSVPTAIGLPIGGSEYSMIYEYPEGVPFLWVKGIAAIPSYMRRLTDSELDEYSLTKPKIATAAWVIFNQ